MRKTTEEYEAGRKRKKQLHVFLSEEEYEYLKYQADSIRFSVSNYVRAALFFNGITVVSNELKLDIDRTIYEMNKIGNNINQIAFNCNVKGSTEMEDVYRLKEQVRLLFEYFENTVLDIHEDY